jgi:raffinose/stachyose/melibiose transport system substrate-binding protein
MSLPPLSRRDALVALAASAALGACAAPHNDKTVRVLHIETNRDVLSIWARAAARLEKQYPGWRVDFRVLEAEAFKARLPTILQSPSKPHLFYSWAGATLDIQRHAGLLDDISKRIAVDHLSSLSAKAVSSYRRGDALYGLPYLLSDIGIVASLPLFDKAGIDPASVADWTGFLAAVERFKSLGMVPLAVGGMDRWQLSLIHSHLTLRSGGRDALAQAMLGDEGGFASENFLAATRRFKLLSDMQPFQPGFLGNKAQSAIALFANGGAAMTMHGTWLYRQLGALMKRPPAEIAAEAPLLEFPRIGASQQNGRQCQLNGWLVSKDAPDAAIAMLQELTGYEAQAELAKGGFLIPSNRRATEAIANPVLASAEQKLNAADFLQVGWATLLGPNGGGAALDAAAGIASGSMGATDAMRAIDRGWQIELAASGLAGQGQAAIDDLLGIGPTA